MRGIRELYELREKLHMNPEKGFEESVTGEIILDFLDKHVPGKKELTVHRVVETGLVIEYRNGGDRPFLLLRADMDALPLTEATGVDFSSKRDGWMHACGHDIHMTILTGTILRVIEDQPEMNILFFYQPAEEGPGGAKPFIDSGFLSAYEIKSAAGLHVTAKYGVGTVAAREGSIFASPTEFDVTFEGVSAHGATPHSGRDSILPAADFLKTGYELLSRTIPPDENYVYTVGKISGGSRRNIVAEETILEGTYRVLKMETKRKIDETIEKLAKRLADIWGVSSSVTFGAHYPVVDNAPFAVASLRRVALENHIDFIECEPSFTGEDFGFLSQMYPSVFFWLGCGNDHMKYDLHSPRFIPDRSCIDIGVTCMYNLLEKLYGDD